MKTISDEELLEITVQFYGREYMDATPERQAEMNAAYMRAEKETNDQIAKAGSVKNWYESGEGRML